MGEAVIQHPDFPERVDIVVVGAGLAGLTAASDLLAAGLSVIVLEARNRIGGRLLNHTLESGAVVELGGQWVGPTQERVLALAEELGVGLFPTYIQGEHFLAVDGDVKRFGGDDFALPEDALVDVGETQEHLQEMARTVPLDEPWRAKEATAWDAQTVDGWLVANSKTGVGLGYWRTIRRGAAAASGTYTLGGHGDGGGVEWVHGRCPPLRREGRPRSAQRLRIDVSGRRAKYGVTYLTK